MRKLTKTAAVVASMAVMAMGATVMTSAATEGWVQSGSNWYYYNGGDRVSNQWVLAGEDWYFLDDEGRMVRNAFIRIDKFNGESEVLDSNDIHDELGKDDIDDDSEFYYLGNDGKMIKGWREMSANSIYASPNSGSSTKVWYYFGSTGRMYVNEWVESNGKWYALSPNGQMYAEAVVNNDLVDWNDTDYFYMDKNGAMVTGWYETTKNWAGSDAKVENIDEDPFSKEMFFYDNKEKWVYGDPVTGVLADEEWKSINNKWYYFGKDARTTKEGVKDDYLNVYIANFKLDALVPEIDYELDDVSSAVSGSSVRLAIMEQEKNNPITPTNDEKKEFIEAIYKGNTGNTDYIEYSLKDEENAPAEAKYAMLSEKVIAWANHESNKDKDEKIKYFYLGKDGAALTTWKEIDDDYYICGNSKGELYNRTVAKVDGRYYYFDANGVCDYKYLNNTADYAVVIGEYESGKLFDTADGRKIRFYETTRKNDSRDENSYYKAEYAKLADIKDNLEEYGVEYVNFGTRSVKVKSLTESEALLAWAVIDDVISEADENGISIYVKDSKGDNTKELNATGQGLVDDAKEKVSIYKLRTSSSIEKKEVTFKWKTRK